MSLALYLFGYAFTFCIGMAFIRSDGNPIAKIASVVGVIGMFTTMISTTYVLMTIPDKDIETFTTDDYSIEIIRDQSSVITTASGHKIDIPEDAVIESNQTITYTAHPAVVNYWFGIATLSQDQYVYTLKNE